MSTIKRAIVQGGIVLSVLDTTALADEAARRHGLAPCAAAALGRTLTAAAYLCSWLKEEQSALSISVCGGGAGGKIFAAGDGGLGLRGFVEFPQALSSSEEADVPAFVGNAGTLTVVRDDGEGIPFVGTSALEKGDVTSDFEAYFRASEQRNVALALGERFEGNRIAAAGGIFFELLPGGDAQRWRSAAESLKKPRGMFSAGSAEEIFSRFGAAVETAREIAFRCRCSRERAAAALRSMGKAGAEELLRERGKIDVHCDDCNTNYTFFEEDIGPIFDGGKL